MKKSENLFLEFNLLHHLLATQFLFGVSFFYHPPEMFIVMGSGRAMPHGVCFKKIYTSLALQEKNTAAREMTCLGAFTVIMRCTAFAVLVSCRAALTEQPFGCMVSKSLASALVWNTAFVGRMRPAI